MTVAVTCAACTRVSRVPESALGRRVRCPYCFDTFTAEAAPNAVLEPVAVAPPDKLLRAVSPEPDVAHLDEVLPAADLPPTVAAAAPVESVPKAAVAPFPPIRFIVLITRDLSAGEVKPLFDACLDRIAPDQPDRAALIDNPLIPVGGR